MENNRILFSLIKSHKWVEFADFLKENDDIDVNIRDNSGNYLINYAITFNHKETVSLLIHHGSRLDIIDAEGRSILYTPIKYEYIDVLNLLLYFNTTNIGISLTDISDNNGNIPLHYAIKTQNIKIINILLQFGSDVNITNHKQQNSLHLAIQTTSVDVCKKILNTNVNINARTDTGETALHIACNEQLVNVVKLLIKFGININIQDYEYQFTALHYSVNLNNIKLTSLLLNANADPNIQDVLGNTPLHYAIIETNYNILDYMINKSSSKNIINYNIYNITSKLPIHILLENQSVLSNTYMNTMILGSNLNFKDNTGQTALHYLSKDNLWLGYIDILKTKKMNIFIKNNKGDRPIDYVDKTHLDKYINMVVESYIYALKTFSFIWKAEWENMCKKELPFNKLSKKELDIITRYIEIKKITNKNNVCYDIIKNKLLEMYKSKEDMCGYTSYPTKKDQKCIKIKDLPNVEFCTFTGNVLDILIGLIYILKKFPYACSTLTKKFIKNNKLCEYYKTIGIYTNTRCIFLNFEIVWVYQKLFISDEFVNKFKKCIANKNNKFVIIPLGIQMRNGSHSNYMIYDIKTKEVERFEPYGATGPHKFDYNGDLLDNILSRKFKNIDSSIKYFSPKNYMPKIGLQYFDVVETNRKKIGDPGGFCALWSIWYVDMRLTYYQVTRKSLVRKIIKIIKTQNMSFRNLIRNYSVTITNLRDQLFKNANMTINDWLNDRYDEEQLITLIKELVKMID